jgi:hypothetical protein
MVGEVEGDQYSYLSELFFLRQDNLYVVDYYDSCA